MSFDNTFVTVAEADAYFKPRKYGKIWNELDDDDKQAEIFNASDFISMRFKLKQSAIDNPPDNLKLATYIVIQNYKEPSDDPQVVRVKIGSIEEQYAENEADNGAISDDILGDIAGLLKDLVISGGGSPNFIKVVL